MPFFIEKNDRTPISQAVQMSNNLISLFCHTFIQVFSGFIVLVDLSRFLQGSGKILFCQQVYCFFTILDSSWGIDTRTYFEYNIADGDFTLGKSANIDNRFHPDTGITV